MSPVAVFRVGITLVGTLALIGCHGEVRSNVCRSLVITPALLAEADAVCLLPEGVLPLDLVDSSLFGTQRGMTLGERISSLGAPDTYQEKEEHTLYVFNLRGRRLEAECLPARSVDQDDLCFWQLRSEVSDPRALLDARLQAIIGESVNAGPMTHGTLSVVGPKRPDGSEETIFVEIIDSMARAVRWYDPTRSKEVRPPWLR